jgi:hypothetical protein
MNSKLAKDLEIHCHNDIITGTQFLINPKTHSQGAGKMALFHLQLFHLGTHV